MLGKAKRKLERVTKGRVVILQHKSWTNLKSIFNESDVVRVVRKISASGRAFIGSLSDSSKPSAISTDGGCYLMVKANGR